MRRSNTTATASFVFEKLKNLSTLILAQNEISNLNEETFNIRDKCNLHTLDLSRNQIESISENLFRDQMVLSVLNLASNKLTRIYANLFIGLKYLSDLNLSNNQLKKIEMKNDLSCLKYLRSLSLNENEIKSISFDRQFKHLQQLELSNNQLEFIEMDDLVRSFKHLTKLAISDNQISLNSFERIKNNNQKLSRRRLNSLVELSLVNNCLEFTDQSMSLNEFSGSIINRLFPNLKSLGLSLHIRQSETAAPANLEEFMSHLKSIFKLESFTFFINHQQQQPISIKASSFNKHFNLMQLYFNGLILNDENDKRALQQFIRPSCDTDYYRMKETLRDELIKNLNDNFPATKFNILQPSQVSYVSEKNIRATRSRLQTQSIGYIKNEINELR